MHDTTRTTGRAAPLAYATAPHTTGGTPENRTMAASGSVTITFTVRSETGPALRSAIDELSNLIGSRLEGTHRFSKEQALTHAAAALGRLRAAVNAAVSEEDPHYV